MYMKGPRFLLFFLLIAWSLPVTAQPKARVLRALKQNTSASAAVKTKAAVSKLRAAGASANTAQQAAQALSVLKHQTAVARTKALEQQAQRSVFILHSQSNTFPATGFVIEEELNGQTFLWGVTAAHLVADPAEAPIMSFVINGHFINYQAQEVVMGHSEAADIALLLLPPQAASQIKPLSVSTQLPEQGENTFSVGYAKGVFKQADNRQILSSSAFRLVTSYELRHSPRRGYCGSPLLNAQNEVIGVHCGSNLKDQSSANWRADLKRLKVNVPDISVAVPAVQILHLLQQYRSQKPHGVLMKAKDIAIAPLQPQQSILYVGALKNKYLRRGINGGPYVNPARLEQYLNIAGADGLLVTVYDPGTPNTPRQIIDYIVNFNPKEVQILPRDNNALFALPKGIRH